MLVLDNLRHGYLFSFSFLEFNFDWSALTLHNPENLYSYEQCDHQVFVWSISYLSFMFPWNVWDCFTERFLVHLLSESISHFLSGSLTLLRRDTVYSAVTLCLPSLEAFVMSAVLMYWHRSTPERAKAKWTNCTNTESIDLSFAKCIIRIQCLKSLSLSWNISWSERHGFKTFQFCLLCAFCVLTYFL